MVRRVYIKLRGRINQRKWTNMKELLIVVSLLVSGVVLEAPYPPSGWRPNGPAFELPARTQSQSPQKSEYLPPVDPRNPNNFDENVDVSVQGLPTAEQQPIFQLSPINGQQYSGPSVNVDISRLNPSLQQAQYQQQLEIARQFARQREYEAAVARQATNQPRFQSPRQFGQTTTTTTTARPTARNPQEETTAEPIDLNEGETLENERNPNTQQAKVSVEVTKQDIQEYPAELFLNPLSQLKFQGQFVPLQQFGQLQNGAPIIYQQIQVTPESEGFDGPAHLSALPSVLAQRELLQQQPLQAQNFAQDPIVVQQEQIQRASQYQAINQYQPSKPQVQPQYQTVQPQIQPQYQPLHPGQYQPAQPDYETVQPQYQPLQPGQYQPVQPQLTGQIQPVQPQIVGQYQPVQPQIAGQYQPVQPQIAGQYQPVQPQIAGQYPPVQPQIAGQYQPIQPQTGQYQPQLAFQPQNQVPNQYQPSQPKDVEEIETNQQPQPSYQPVQQYQPPNGLIIARPINFQNQDLNLFYQQQQQYDANQPQGSLQSGLDINQQGNGIEEQEKENEEQDEGTRTTAVATAFGTRTQPRVVAQYGVPSDPRVQATPRYRTTTEPAQEAVTEDGPAVAEATAVASGRRNAKLRSRRVRPIFTLDKSGHLVLANEQ